MYREQTHGICEQQYTLAGYAVECILKVYIISRVASANSLAEAITKRRDAGEEIPNILSAEGHKLLTLLSLTDLEARFGDDERKKDWSLCVKWKSTWRYDPEPPKTADALRVSCCYRFASMTG